MNDDPIHRTEDGLTHLDPAAKTDWMEALRSGRYKQRTSGGFFGPEPSPTYCCLAVLVHRHRGYVYPQGEKD